jgi:hypothetical protein
MGMMLVLPIVEHVCSAGVDHRSAQAFREASLPVRSRVPMSEIANQESRRADHDPQLIVYQAGGLTLIKPPQIESGSPYFRDKVISDDSVQLSIAVSHGHEAVAARGMGS